jgi:5-methylcytosine-specific restriction endonuclease McrA
VDDDGMLVMHGRLTPEQGAVVQRALEAAAEQLWREAREAAAPQAVIEDVTPGQRRADAMVRLAEAALAGSLDGGTAGDRYQVILHVDAGHDSAAAGEPGRLCLDGATIECGDRAVDVSAETSARLACDAAIVVMRHDAVGHVLDVGRKTRSVPSAIRRALDARDTGCRFPGCTARRCDAHHVVHWADGGATSLDNLMLLCRHHHRLLHEGGYTVRRDDERDFVFVTAAGRVVAAVPAAPALSYRAPASASLCRLPGNEAYRPVTPATWDGSRFDVGYVIDMLRGGEPMSARRPSA